ncbi:MAG: hypothetical protein Q9185_004559 [Variospora sp. 1 TL-2023]
MSRDYQDLETRTVRRLSPAAPIASRHLKLSTGLAVTPCLFKIQSKIKHPSVGSWVKAPPERWQIRPMGTIKALTFFSSVPATGVVNKLLRSMQGSASMRGLVYWCEHDYDHPCDIVPQAVFTSSPLAIWDFSQVPWIRCSIYRCLKIFRGPLQGLVQLHAKGYMHRDVTLKNMFFLSENPDRAVLGDFGKAVRAKTDLDASIGPAASRAPEVDGKSPYSDKIDVWSMGWALLWAVGYDCLRGFWETLPLNFDAWHRRVMEVLTITKEKGSGTSWLASVADLLIGMLTLDPATRISAAKTLTQVASLLASPPPEEASPQLQSPKPSPLVSDLSERDARIEPGGLSTSFEKQAQHAGASGKKARLG